MKIGKISSLKIALFVFATIGGVLSFSGGDVLAATKTWTGGGGSDNDFSASANWSPSGAPVDGDSLVFPFMSGGVPRNDIVDLEISGITFTGGTSAQSTLVLFAQPAELTGSVSSNGSQARGTISGGFELGGNLEVTNTILSRNVFGSDSPLNEIRLAGHTLGYKAQGYTSILAVEVPIVGAGTVNYSGITALQLSQVNTYSGTTNISSVGSILNTVSPSSSRNPSQMFGSSSIFIDGDSQVQLSFSSSGSFANPITLSATTVNGNTFNAQLEIAAAGSASQLAVQLTNLTLSGSGGISVNTEVSTVDLAGIQTNGFCLYTETVNQDRYLNAPTFCGGSAEEDVSTTDGEVPGVPETGSSSLGFQTGLIVLGVTTLAITLQQVYSRTNMFQKRR